MNEWSIDQLGNLAESFAGGTPSRSVPEYYGGEIPWVKSTEVNQDEVRETGEFITKLGLKFSNCKLAPENSVLLAMYGATAGQVSKLKIRAATNQAVLAIICKTALDSSYLYYVLLNKKNEILYLAQGSGQTNLSKALIDRTDIHLPVNAVQQKIAHILTTIDNLIDKTQTLIDKYTAIKQGMMADLFTRGIDLSGTPDTNPNYGQLRPPYEEAPELYKQSELGWVPKEWEVVKLESLLAKIPSAMRSGPFGSALLKHELVEEGIPLLGIDNVFVEKYNNTYKRFVTIEKFRELARYSVRSGDVVITIMGTVGRCCVVPNLITKALSSKHLWTMTFDSEIVVPELMCWQLNHASWVKTWFHQKSQGGIMEAIQSSTLKTVLVPTPSMAEQEYIFEKYQNICSRINTEGVLFDKLSVQKKGLMQDLLTGKVCVEV